ncbi:MAG: hypothetical protein H0T73_20875 [Ardenticatenales bacterium]|nr:hypothetical protein [Ardenticatenales bacterium]
MEELEVNIHLPDVDIRCIYTRLGDIWEGESLMMSFASGSEKLWLPVGGWNEQGQQPLRCARVLDDYQEPGFLIWSEEAIVRVNNLPNSSAPALWTYDPADLPEEVLAVVGNGSAGERAV